MSGDSLEDVLRKVEDQGGSAIAGLSPTVRLAIWLSGYRQNGLVMSASVTPTGPTLPDGTPVRWVDGKLVRMPRDYDPLGQSSLRDDLKFRGWKVDGTGLGKEWLLRSDADRALFRKDIEDVIAMIGSDRAPSFRLMPPDSDAGFGQVGCVVVAAPVGPGVAIGVVVSLILGASFNLLNVVIALIAAIVGGAAASTTTVKLAPAVPRLRPRAEEVAILVGVCVSGTLAAIVPVLLVLVFGPRGPFG